MTPAKTPGPIIAIKRRAQISELIERVATIINRAIGLIINLRGRRVPCSKKRHGNSNY